jgi:hypothetical protein
MKFSSVNPRGRNGHKNDWLDDESHTITHSCNHRLPIHFGNHSSLCLFRSGGFILGKIREIGVREEIPRLPFDKLRVARDDGERLILPLGMTGVFQSPFRSLTACLRLSQRSDFYLQSLFIVDLASSISRNSRGEIICKDLNFFRSNR